MLPYQSCLARILGRFPLLALPLISLYPLHVVRMCGGPLCFSFRAGRTAPGLKVLATGCATLWVCSVRSIGFVRRVVWWLVACSYSLVVVMCLLHSRLLF